MDGLLPAAGEPARRDCRPGPAAPSLLKFSLGGDQGLGVLAIGFPVSVDVDCATLAYGARRIERDGQPRRQRPHLRPASTGTYTYVWKTEKAWAGSCRIVSVRLVDGTTHEAYVRLR